MTREAWLELWRSPVRRQQSFRNGKNTHLTLPWTQWSNSDAFLLQCVPLYTLLAALGHPTVNWFILDIEGAELQVNKEKFTRKVENLKMTLTGPEDNSLGPCGHWDDQRGDWPGWAGHGGIQVRSKSFWLQQEPKKCESLLICRASIMFLSVALNLHLFGSDSLQKNSESTLRAPQEH